MRYDAEQDLVQLFESSDGTEGTSYSLLLVAKAIFFLAQTIKKGAS